MATDRPLYAEIADPGSLARFGEEIEAADPSDWPGYPDQLRRARTVTGARHAVTTGGPVPVTSVVIGEGVSGGALALASPSDLWIAQDGYLAVTTPELATSILKLGVDDVPQVATWLRLTPAELMSRGIVRGIIRPPAATASVAGQAADPR